MFIIATELENISVFMSYYIMIFAYIVYLPASFQHVF